MDINKYSAHILVNGRKVKEYRHNGLTFIEAKEGTEFAIEVKNHLGAKILAVVSIDGLDIIEGKPATLDSRGYIIAPYHADTFNGWRKSDTEIGAFQFTASGKSYATEKGVGKNNGIIAIKFFEEKSPPALLWNINVNPVVPSNPNFPWPTSFPMYSGAVGPSKGILRSHGLSAGNNLGVNGSPQGTTCLGVNNQSATAYSCSVEGSSSVQDMSAFDMGTTWGSKREDKVVTAEFERGREIASFEFYYASREALSALGIPLVIQREVSLPRGFESTPYAQPPKNWK